MVEIQLSTRAVRYQRPNSASAAWAGRLGLFAVLLLLFGVAGHRFSMLETENFVAIALLAVTAALLALVLGIVGLWRLWKVGARGGRASFWGILLALVPLLPFAFAAERYIDRPRLNDVTTDLANPPAFLKPPAEPNGWLSQVVEQIPAVSPATQQTAYPELTGRRYEGAIDRVSAAVLAVLEARGIAIVATEGVELRQPEPEPEPVPETSTGERPGEEAAGLSPPDILNPPLPIPAPRAALPAAPVVRPSRMVIQAEAASPVLAIESDVVIRLIEEEETTRVDMRAATRHAGHDLGLNAWTIERFLTALDAELLGVAAD